MDANKRKPTYRKPIIGALVVLTGLALCAVVVIVAVGAFSAFQEGRESLGTMQEAFQTSPEKAKEVFQTDREITQEVQMVDIVPSPRIVWLQDAGDSQRLSVQGYYSDGSVGELDPSQGAAVSYESSDSSVAHVDSEGVVTGVKAAGADVTVTYGNFHATVPIFVWGPERRVPPYDRDRLLAVSDDGSAIVLNRIMTELQPGYSSNDANLVASRIDGEVVFKFDTFPGYLVEFSARTEKELEQALAVLRSDRRVVLAYPDMLIPVINGGGNTPIETFLLSDDKKKTYVQAGMRDAWTSMNWNGKFDPVNIAIIDSGFLAIENVLPLEAELLKREFDLSRFWFHGDLGQSSGKAADHGTAVASVIVANNNDRRSADIPPDSFIDDSFSGVVTSVEQIDYGVAFYLAGKSLRTTDINNKIVDKALQNIAETTNALETISKHRGQFDVVNMSFAGRCKFACGHKERWRSLMKEMKDITFVAGAGNQNEDARMWVPAAVSLDLPNVITVGSVDSYGQWSKFSNYGTAVTLGAPGEEVWIVDSHGYRYNSGTSFSTSLVTGTVVLMKALKPSLGPSDIKDILIETGNKNHNVCKNVRPESTPTPRLSSCEKLPILDAGAAVERVISDSVNGTIRHPLVNRDIPDPLDVTVPVMNTGSIKWKFRLDAVLTTSGNKVLDSAIKIVPPTDTYETRRFKLSFPRPTWGERVELRLYRSDDTAKVLHSRELVIPLVFETLTPPPTPDPTPTPRPTATAVAVPTPTPLLVRPTIANPPMSSAKSIRCPTGTTEVEWVSATFWRKVDLAQVQAELHCGADVSAAKAEDGRTPLHQAVLYTEDPAIFQIILDAGADAVQSSRFVNGSPLHLAITNGNATAVHAILDYIEDADKKSSTHPDSLDCPSIRANWRTWRFWRQAGGFFKGNSNLNNVRRALDCGVEVNVRDEAGLTPLHWATIFTEDPSIIRLLLEAGANVTAKDEVGLTPLHCAAVFHQHPEVTQLLLDRGADPDARTLIGRTPLFKAAQHNESLPVIQALVRSGSNVNARTYDTGITPLHHALSGDNENPAVASLLLKAGADVNAAKKNGSTPLSYAVEFTEDLETIRALIDGGADAINWRADYGGNLLILAAAFNRNPVVTRLLLEAGVEVNLADNSGLTPLHGAAQVNNPAVVQTLLDAGANVDALDHIGWPPLHHAAFNNDNPGVIQALLEAGANVHAANNDSLTPLHVAAQSNGNSKIIQALLEADANVHAADNDSLTSLHFAAQHNDNAAVIQALLDAGADVHAKNNNGLTPLHSAGWNNDNPAVAQILLDAGANVHAKNNNGLTPLHSAGWNNDNPAVAQILLDAGADANARNVSGVTPLFPAVQFQETPVMIWLLLDAGADVNTGTDDNGATPLHSAAMHNENTPVIKALLEAGADVMATNVDGDTAWDLARREGNNAFLEALESTSEVPACQADLRLDALDGCSSGEVILFVTSRGGIIWYTLDRVSGVVNVPRIDIDWGAKVERYGFELARNAKASYSITRMP